MFAAPRAEAKTFSSARLAADEMRRIAAEFQETTRGGGVGKGARMEEREGRQDGAVVMVADEEEERAS